MFNKDKISKDKIITVLIVIGILYFSFFFLFGRYGFLQYSQLKREKASKANELQEISDENLAIQAKIDALQSSNLDKDLLDEQVRKSLGYVEDGEIIIYYD